MVKIDEKIKKITKTKQRNLQRKDQERNSHF